MAAPSTAELKEGMNIILAVTETIREAGEVPEGTLYTALIGRVTIEGFEKIMGILTNAGLVERKNHVARWIGPLKTE